MHCMVPAVGVSGKMATKLHLKATDVSLVHRGFSAFSQWCYMPDDVEQLP